MTTLKDMYEKFQSFLVPYSEDVNTEVAKFLPIIDSYIYSNFYRVIVDELTYSHFLPLFLKAHKFEFERVYKAINAEYNPIENYSMLETNTSTKESEETTKETIHSGEKINEREEKGSLIVTSENSDSVIDTDDMKLSNTNTTTTTPNEYGSTQTEKYNDYKTTEKITHGEPETVLTTTQRTGNIGVTTSQQMIQSTIDLEKYNSFVQYVTFKFINELTTGVYNYD